MPSRALLLFGAVAAATGPSQHRSPVRPCRLYAHPPHQARVILLHMELLSRAHPQEAEAATEAEAVVAAETTPRWLH